MYTCVCRSGGSVCSCACLSLEGVCVSRFGGSMYTCVYRVRTECMYMHVYAHGLAGVCTYMTVQG